MILGFDVGYERLNSKIQINSYHVGMTAISYPATGHTYLNTDFLNLHPNIGYRLGSKILLDLTVSTDIGLILWPV